MIPRTGTVASGLGFTFKSVRRIGQTTRVLAGTGVGWLRGDRPPTPELTRRTFEQLGATYIKLGQFIASSPSIFPEEWVEEFQRCLDRTEPVPFAPIKQAVEEDLGGPVEQFFAWLDPEPLASASIAQVHAARLHDGSDVVVKVVKPGVRNTLLTDLAVVKAAAHTLEFAVPGLKRASLSAVVEEIRASMIEECDLLSEAENIEQYRRFLEDHGHHHVVVPKVHPHVSGSRVLTMERFYGAPLTDLEAIRRNAPDPEATLIDALNVWFASLLQCRFFHADLHAGNLLVLTDGRVGFIDFGIVGRIRQATWTALTSLGASVPMGDYPAMAEALATMGATRDDVDTAALAKDLEELVERIENFEPDPASATVPAEDVSVNHLLMDIIGVGDRHGIRFPREFTLLVKQLLYFDRYIRLLSPGLDLFGDARLHALPSLE